MLSESDFRKKVQETLDRLERHLSDVDPDVVECEQAFGAMTLTFPDRSRCILSAQPSVRQLWLALASLGMAHHFNWDESNESWIDDKGKGLELISYLRQFLRDKTGLSLEL